MYAPLILFVYNRYDNVHQSLTALSKNTLARFTDIYIYSDGPKNSVDAQKVSDVRSLIHSELWKSYFSNIYIIEAIENKGLANSIISGVDSIIRKTKKAIVIEDDCISSPDFLKFMNDCLDYYEKSENIWSIGGYSPNMTFPADYKYDVYLMGRTCSYAWATWLDRWEKVDWNLNHYVKFHFNLKQRKAFDKYGMDRSKMLDLQYLGKKNSWAIRFCFAMYCNEMYTIYPRITRIANKGYNEGTHVNAESKNGSKFEVKLSNTPHEYVLSKDISLDERIVKSFSSLFKRNRLKLFVAYIINSILILLKTK